MRCTHCNWDNPEGASRCQKCNRPLERIQPSTPAPVQPQSNDWKSRSTVCYDAGPAGGLEEKTICPGCSYPVMHGDSACPNCGHIFAQESVAPICEGAHTSLDAGFVAGVETDAGNHGRTVCDASFRTTPQRATVLDGQYAPNVSRGTVMDASFQGQTQNARGTVMDASFRGPVQNSRGTVMDAASGSGQNSTPSLLPINCLVQKESVTQLNRGDVIVIDNQQYLIV